jgi:hypothetical protein
VKRFKAGNLRVRRVEGLAAALQEVEGLKNVAGALRSSGLVQVDEANRVFGMHQLLQQAVGKELGWQRHCNLMQALLQARCGQFGDEQWFDVGRFGVMREVSGAAVAAVGRVRDEGLGQGEAWCSGMLLRLYEVAIEVHGLGPEFPTRILTASHNSLVADLVHAHVMKEGCKSECRLMKLGAVIDAARLHPHIRHIIARDPEFHNHQVNRLAVKEERLKTGASRAAAWESVCIRRFKLRKCLESYWGPGAQASLVARLVHAHVMQEGCTSPEGKTLPMQAVAAVPLIKDIVGFRGVAERDLGQLLKDACGLRIVDDGCGGSSVLAQGGGGAAGEGDDDVGGGGGGGGGGGLWG